MTNPLVFAKALSFKHIAQNAYSGTFTIPATVCNQCPLLECQVGSLHLFHFTFLK